MAHVIPFRIAARPERAARTAATSAEIVIFPGVRYEYHKEGPPAATAPAASQLPASKPKRRVPKSRDRLELID